MKKICWLIAILVFFPGAASADNNSDVWENGKKLHESIKTWQVLTPSNDGGVWWFDPYSIVNNGGVWESDISFANSSNEYDPNQTNTLTIDCASQIFDRPGWRIDGVMVPYPKAYVLINLGRILFGDKPAPTVKPETVEARMRDHVCGKDIDGARYYGMVGDFKDRKQKDTFQYYWLKENEVLINSDNNDLRMLIGPRKVVKYVKCSTKSLMGSKDGKSISAWIVGNAGSVLQVLVDTACGKMPYRKFTTEKFDVPEPLPPSPSPEAVANASRETSLDSAKAKCADLGFKKGTQKYGECVLKLSR